LNEPCPNSDQHQISPIHRVRTGHGKPGKSWNFRISFSRPGKSWNLSVGHGKSWKMVLIVQNKLGRLFFFEEKGKTYLKSRKVLKISKKNGQI